MKRDDKRVGSNQEATRMGKGNECPIVTIFRTLATSLMGILAPNFRLIGNQFLSNIIGITL